MAGLPYDSTPPPDDRIAPSDPSALSGTASGPDASSEPAADAMDVDGGVDPLDRPLDEYNAPLPAHVQSLMARMGQGKVYMIDETPGLLHDARDDRIRGDTRIAALAEQLNQHDPTEWLVAASAGSASPIRNNALFVRSDLIKHLSTSKVFGWVTSLGADAMGIEWLNDTSLIILFPSSASALLALSLMSKAGFDPAEGDDPLVERSAHAVPLHLLPHAGLDAADKKEGQELLPPASATDEGGVKRRGRGAFQGEGSSRLASETDADRASEILRGYELAPGVDEHARLTIRFALEGDKSLRALAKESEWYKKNGRHAGKEKHAGAPRRREDRYEDLDAGWSGAGAAGDGEDGARELKKRMGRERVRAGPYDRPNAQGGRERGGRDGRGQTSVDDMDKQLERFARQKAGEDVGDEEPRRERVGRRGERRERRDAGDLDKELDDMFAARAGAE